MPVLSPMVSTEPGTCMARGDNHICLLDERKVSGDAPETVVSFFILTYLHPGVGV